jgi:hypothetical protein
MGEKIIMELDTNLLKKQLNPDLKAEIVCYEIQKKIQKNTKVLAAFEGISKRNKSKDLLDISTLLYQDQKGYTNEAIVLHISKNSIYHNLPELLFHPLSISNPTMSNKEIVAQIKKNRETQKDSLSFFMPLDNELFKQYVKLSKRCLQLFNDENTLFFKIIDELIAIDCNLTDLQKQNLFLFLGENQKYKENLPELEKLLTLMIENPVSLKYKKKYLTKMPFPSLSKAILGYDLGISGIVESEIDDIEATFFFDGNIDYIKLTKKMELTKNIMSYFTSAARKIDFLFFNNYQLGITVNQNYLGINTIL